MSSVPVIAALRSSHERLRALVGSLDATQVRGPSYASEWSVAQVLSHLGSGAVIGKLGLDAARAGAPAPDRTSYVTIWDEWNAKTPDEQAAEVLPADLALVEAYEALDASQLEVLRIPFGPMQLDAAGMARMRLGEHAVHAWDIAVAFDPEARVEAVAVEQLIDGLGFLAGMVGKAGGRTSRHRVTTLRPEREFVLDVGEKVSLTEWDGQEQLAHLTLPAETLLRLVYGRLDDSRIPMAHPVDPSIEELRAAFPGF